MNQIKKIRLSVVAAGVIIDFFLTGKFSQVERNLLPEALLNPLSTASLLMSFIVGLPPVLFAGILIGRLLKTDAKLNAALLGILLTFLPVLWHSIFPTWYIIANCLLLVPVAVVGSILGSSSFIQTRFSVGPILLFYSWIAGSYLTRPFYSTLLFLLEKTLAHASQQIAGIVAWPFMISSCSFLVAFLYMWLAEGSWIKCAFQTWVVIMIASWLEVGSGGALAGFYFIYALLFSLFLPGLIHLSAALFGCWLASKRLLRNFLEPARSAFLKSALLPSE